MAAISAGEPETGSQDKIRAASASVAAAVGLTTIKATAGLLTGSLGILSEAAHSALDLVAAIVTLLAVRLADRPADREHLYGHGKVENLSALAETLLLLLTCVWIVYESVRRLFVKAVAIQANGWAFAVVGISIIVDIGRSRALLKAARKHNSQALEADALHFSTDVWSSSVVLLGLALVRLGRWLHSPTLTLRADPAAALLVAGLVAWVSVRLARQTVAALMDTAPAGTAQEIARAARDVRGVLGIGRVRVRRAGNQTFADVNVSISRNLPLEETHSIAENVEKQVQSLVPGADVVVHTDPQTPSNETSAVRIQAIAARHGLIVHHVLVHDNRGACAADIHLEVDPALNLKEAHDVATGLESSILAELPEIRVVNTHIEPLEGQTPSLDIATRAPEGIQRAVKAVCASVDGVLDCHDLQMRALPEGLSLSLHCTFDETLSIGEVHRLASQLERRLRDRLPRLAHVLVHAEPPDPG